MFFRMGAQHYWAFLSYSSKDAAFVKKLHAKLETYRMPRDLVGRPGLDEPIPQKLFPVFRDRDELPLASDLGSTIQDALKSSRYLIVVCSPHSARSQWVNEEIRYFKSIGRSHRILALIIDGEPHASTMTNPPAEECFPQALRFHVEENGTISDRPTEPIAGDLRPGKDGWDLAFLKCIAGITGCGLNALTDREKKRARKRKAMLGIAAMALCAAGLYAWDYTRIKQHYYASVAERFGVPEGYYSLDASDVAKREKSYLVESSRRKVRRVTAIHSSGTPVATESFGASTLELKFGEDGSIQEILYRNRYGKINARKLFSALKDGSRIVEFKTEKDDSPMALAANDISLKSSAAVTTKTEVTAHRVTYDEQGRLLEVRFLSSWREPRADPDGVFGLRYTYEDGPFHSSVANLNTEGKVVKNRRGFAVARSQRHATGKQQAVSLFDENGNAVVEPDSWHRYEFAFDAHGNTLRKWFVDEKGQRCETVRGFAEMTTLRSESGDVIDTRHFDLQGNPVIEKDGFHQQLDEYDEWGNCVKTRFFDAQGKPCVDAEMVHERRMKYNHAGEIIEQSNFDVNGKPCYGGPYQVHHEVFGFTELGYVKSIAYFDIHNQPMVPPNMDPHRVEFSINESGRMAGWKNYGKDGKLLHGKDQEIIVTMKHDAVGNITEYANWDQNNEPKNLYGVHRRVNVYDQRGMVKEVINFRADGSPAEDSFEKIHRTVNRYDERGHKVGISFFGADGKPTTDVSKVHRYAYVADDRGNYAEEAFFDEKDEMMTMENGVYQLKKKFNHAGNATEISYFDQEKTPMLSRDGFHRFTSAYDARGNKTEIYYYGLDGKAVLHRESKAHGIVSGYDALNRENEISYFGVKLEPIVGESGWHRRSYELDERGNATAVRFFGVDDKPVMNDEQLHLLRIKWNEQKEAIAKTCFDTSEKPCLCMDGWHAYTLDYSSDRLKEDRRYFDTAGKPMCIPEHKSHRELVVWSEDRSQKLTSYFGPDGAPCLDDEGVHQYQRRIENGHITRAAFFDVKGLPHYFGQFCTWEKKYNDLGQCTETRWLDEDDEPALNSSGVHIQTARYHPDGKVAEYAHFGPDKEPILNNDGVHRWRQEWEGNDITKVIYLDPHGAPAKDSNGVHIVENDYDERGNIKKKMYFGTNGKPMIMPEGNSGYESQYDAANREYQRTWLDAEGKPIEMTDGIARWKAKFDNAGRERERRFYNALLEATCGTLRHHLQTTEFDDNGNQTVRALFDEKDQPCMAKEGFHRRNTSFRNDGYLLEESFFDAQQNPICLEEGHHRRVNEVDERGNTTKSTFFGAKGEPVLWMKQYHILERKFSPENRELYARIFGTQGEPVNNDDGYQQIVKEYDQHGRIETLTYTDAAGNESAKMGFHKLTIEYYLDSEFVAKKSYYDSRKKLLFEQKFDLRGNPIE